MSEATPVVGRNEPCPCGSGKKYKRCHGQDAPGKVAVAAAPAAPAGVPGMPAGFDPSQIDPQMMSQMGRMLQRLPKGQMIRLQTLIQKAMQGKDVARELTQLQHELPPDFQTMLNGFAMAQAGAMNATPPMPQSEDEARKILDQAVKDGSITQEQYEAALAGSGSSALPEAKSGFGKIWDKIKGSGSKTSGTPGAQA